MTTKEIEYRIWVSIKQRCFPSEDRFSYEEGVPMEEDWKNSYIKFVEDIGERPDDDYFLIRKNKKKGFVRGNCYWSKEPPRPNGRPKIFIKYNNKRQSLKQWAKETGISYKTLLNRYHSGWEPEDLLTITPKKGNSELRLYKQMNYYSSNIEII